jgi:hypothetical protein
MTIKAYVQRLWGGKLVKRVMVAGSFASFAAVAIYIYATFQLLSPVQSYPLVGGIWQADFNVMSVNPTDLTISFIKPTTREELQFVELYCKGIEVPFYGRESGVTWEGGTTSTYYYKWYNYKCDGITTWKVKVLKPGSHQQRIQFGNIKQDIYNDASIKATLIKSECGVIECTGSLMFEVPITVRLPAIQNKDFNIRFDVSRGSIRSYTISVKESVRKVIPNKVMYCHDEIIVWDNNGTPTQRARQSCQNVEDWNSPPEIVDVITDIGSSYGVNLVADHNYIIEIKIKRNKPYTEPFRIDWIMSLAGHSYREFAWWDADWAYKKAIRLPNQDMNAGDTIQVPSINFTTMSVMSDLNDVRIVDENKDAELDRLCDGTSASTDGNCFFFTDYNFTKNDSDMNTTYYLYYGNPVAGAPPDSNVERARVCNFELGNCEISGTTIQQKAVVKFGMWDGSTITNGAVRFFDSSFSTNGMWDWNYSGWIRAADATQYSVFRISAAVDHVCSIGVFNDAFYIVYNGNESEAYFGTSADDTWYKFIIHYKDGDANCGYQIKDSTGADLIPPFSFSKATSATIPIKVSTANYSATNTTYISNIFRGMPFKALGLGGQETSVESDSTPPTITWMQPGNNAWKSGRFYLNFVITDNNAIKTGWIDSNVACFKNTVDIIYEDFDDRNSASRWVMGTTNDTNGYLWQIGISPAFADENFLVNDFNLHAKLRTDRSGGYSNVEFLNNTMGTNYDSYHVYITPLASNPLRLSRNISGAETVICSAIGDFNFGEWVVVDLNRKAGIMSLSAENGLYSCSVINEDYNRNTYIDLLWTTTSGIDDVIFESYDFNIFDGDYNLMSWDSAGLGCESIYDANVTVHAVDWNAQNGIAQSSRIIKIDNSPPVTLNDANNVWQTGDANVNFKCTDLGSGCKQFFYTVGSTNYSKNWGDANIGVSVTSDGNTLITFWSSDQTDANEVAKYAYVAIDKTDPIVIITLPQDGNQSYTSNTVSFDLNDLGGINIATLHADINGVSSTDINWPTQCTKLDSNFRCSYTETMFNINNRDYNLTIYIDDNSNRSGRHTHTFKWKASPTILVGNVNEYYQSDVNGIDLYPTRMIDQNVIPRGQNDLNGIFNIWNKTIGSIDINVFLDLNVGLPSDSNLTVCKQNRRVLENMVNCFDINANSEALIITNLDYDANQMFWWFFDLNIIGPYPGFELVIDYQYRSVIA